MEPINNFSLSEQLAYSTIRLICELDNGGTSIGTGYVMQFLHNKENNLCKNVVITNQHVIENSNKITMFFNINVNGKPVDTEKRGIVIQKETYQQLIVKHSEVDLCAIDITSMILAWQNMYKTDLYILPIPIELIPTQNDLEELKQIEDIIMVGYPIGLMDDYNNKPIFRKGITATHPKLNYNNKKEFLIDIACFHGSSGSPVFILNEGSYSDKFCNVRIGGRIMLLGTVYQNRIECTNGEIRVMDIPTSSIPYTVTGIPINIGAVIKSETLYDLENMIKNKPV